MTEKNSESVGVIIPVYNVEEYLEDCLDSIANQTVKFEEVILVNDGSKDASQSICEEYCKKFNYFKLINQENQGQAVARNNGLNNIKSKYIMFVDADDFIVRNANEILQKQLEQKNLDILFYSSDVQFDIDTKNKRNIYIRSEKLCNTMMSGMDFLKRSFPAYYIVSPCLAVYRKDFLQQNNILFPAGYYYEDNFFALQCMCQAQNVMCIQKKLYVRRYRENSTTTSELTGKKMEDNVTINKMMWQYISEVIRPKTTDFWKGYISYGIIETFNMLEKFEDIKVRTRYEKKLIYYFFEYCNCLIKDQNPTIELYCTFLKIYTCILKIGLCFFASIKSLPKTEEEIQELRKDIKEKVRGIIDYKLREVISQGYTKKIAIYGTGEHTGHLLKYVDQYHGNIFGELYFVETDGEKLKFMDDKMRKIDISESIIDIFILSSLTYQDDMENELNTHGIKSEKIILLYDEASAFDLVKIIPILSEQ